MATADQERITRVFRALRGANGTLIASADGQFAFTEFMSAFDNDVIEAYGRGPGVVIELYERLFALMGSAVFGLVGYAADATGKSEDEVLSDLINTYAQETSDA